MQNSKNYTLIIKFVRHSVQNLTILEQSPHFDLVNYNKGVLKSNRIFNCFDRSDLTLMDSNFATNTFLQKLYTSYMKHKYVAPSQPPPTPLTTPQQADSQPSSQIYEMDKELSQDQQPLVIDTVTIESQTPLSQDVEQTEKEKQRKQEIEQRLMEKKAKQEKKTRKLFT